jgi:3-dehydroquinate dehydratase-2
MKLIRVGIINGPNLNLLGHREPAIYGSQTLKDLERVLKAWAKKSQVSLSFYQSNHEGALIDELHRLRKIANGIVINPGALTHYSYALRDGIAAIGVPTVEVHLSNIKKREPFRKKSVTAPVCVAQVSGLGFDSYIRGLEILTERLRRSSP